MDAQRRIDWIQQRTRDDLLELCERLSEREPIDGFADGDGKAFEHLVLRAFEMDGAEVRWPFRVPLGQVIPGLGQADAEQIDGVVYAEGVSYLLEMKDQAEAVNIDPLAKLRYRLSRRPATAMGMIFTTSPNGFTEPARTMARFMTPLNVLLWEMDEVKYALSQQGGMVVGLRQKYRAMVELGVPDHFLGES